MRALPESPDVLRCLLAEVIDFVDQMQTFQQMLARLLFLLREAVSKGDTEPDPATANYLEHQREAIARWVANLRSCGRTFCNYLPETALDELRELKEVLRAIPLVAARSPHQKRLYLSVLEEFNRRLNNALRHHHLLRELLLDRLAAPTAKDGRAEFVGPADLSGATGGVGLREDPSPASGPTTHKDSNSVDAVSKRRPAKPGERAQQIYDYLHDNPNATSVEVAGWFGISDGYVRNSAPWKRNQAEHRERMAQVGERERSNRDSVIDGAASGIGDPSEHAAVREQVDRLVSGDHPEELEKLQEEFLRRLTPSERKKFKRLTPEEMRLEIGAWKLTNELVPRDERAWSGHERPT